jgi:hypothetical protein
MTRTLVLGVSAVAIRIAMMVRYSSFLVAFLALSSAYVAAQYPPTYTVSSWPGGIKDLPCSAFRKNGLDSWTLIANVYAGGMIMSNVTFHKGDELKMIEEKCGTK